MGIPRRNAYARLAPEPSQNQESREHGGIAPGAVEALEALMDAPWHTDLGHLLPTLLGRLSPVLGLEGLAILLLSDDGAEFTVYAANGAAGIRRPAGPDLAGRIAATGASLIADVGAERVISFAGQGLRSLMGVPLLAQGKIIGVLQAGATAPRRFTAGDLRLLRLLADRLALTIAYTRLSERERRVRAQAVAATRAHEAFLATAAHELKTPLASLMGFAQLLLQTPERGMTPERLNRALGTIVQQSERLNRQICQLLDTLRAGAGELIVHPRLVDVAALVDGVAATLQAQTTSHRILAQVQKPAPARVDPGRLEQVMLNLVGNAVRYSLAGTSIAIRVTMEAPDLVRITVQDQGLGIPMEHRERLFERFYQAHAASYRSGMGLGLYISRQIIELHGGTLEAEYPPEGGTRFVILLPAETADAAGLPASP